MGQVSAASIAGTVYFNLNIHVSLHKSLQHCDMNVDVHYSQKTVVDPETSSQLARFRNGQMCAHQAHS
jgi:hypothetical protein